MREEETMLGLYAVYVEDGLRPGGAGMSVISPCACLSCWEVIRSMGGGALGSSVFSVYVCWKVGVPVIFGPGRND